VAAPRLRARLPYCPRKRRPLGQEGHGENHVGEERAARLVSPAQREDALEHREAGAGDEDPECRQQRPEVPLLAVPERVPAVAGPVGQAQRGQQQALVECVGQRVSRLGQHGTRAGDQAGGQLQRRNGEVGAAGDQHGAPSGAQVG
jgi:hypothetical protein